MKLDELMQPGWGDAVDYFHDRKEKYGTTELNVPSVIQPQTADDTAPSVPTTFSERLETLDSVPGKLQMPQVTYWPESSDLGLCSQNPQTHECIPSFLPTPMPYWSHIQQSKRVEPVSCNPCILRTKLITIWKSDSYEDMVMAPVQLEESIGKLAFVTMYQFEMQ